jgi:cytochrome oxidase assembly protein ShyY1
VPQDNHLSYALTWYSLALALAVIVVIARRRIPRD